MPFPRFLFHSLRTNTRTWLGISVVMASVWMTGCAMLPAGGASEGSPGTVAESELHRLAQTRLQLAALHFEEGRAEVALGEVAQALHANPRYVDAYNLKGWIHLSLNDYRLAQESFSQALALRPGDADSLYNLGWLQCQQAQYAEADKNFDAALGAPRSSSTSVMRLWLAKGVCLRQAGRLSGAVRALEKALEFDPGDPTVAYNFADALHAQGDAERARFYVRRINNGPWNSAASLWLGIKVERSLGDRIAVRQLADQLHKRFPDSKEWQRFERGAFDD
ncbi:tetratricopeptide repeat protein [Comamonas sp.]